MFGISNSTAVIDLIADRIDSDTWPLISSHFMEGLTNMQASFHLAWAGTSLKCCVMPGSLMKALVQWCHSPCMRVREPSPPISTLALLGRCTFTPPPQ
eukprot:3077918-Amphidinium_carterae.1